MLTSSDHLVVTLIVPCYQGARWISTCLKSIVDQTLDRQAFEVIVVINGTPDDSPGIVHQVFEREPTLHYQVVFAEQASLSHARNVGVELAEGEWVTWVDVDDWLSPNYLRELVEAAEEGVVPLAKVVDVDEQTGRHTEPRMTEEILADSAGRADPALLWRPLTFAACKLLPTHLARQSAFDTALTSGEDVAYFAPFMARHDLMLDTTPAHHGATYYRLLRSGSMSRQEPSYDFSVTDRIAVMKRLDAAAQAAPSRYARVMRSMMSSQALFISRYLDISPDDYPRVRAALTEARLESTPWKAITSRTPHLAVLYSLTPFLDADDAPEWQHLARSGRHWNLISNEGVATLVSTVSRHATLPTSHAALDWVTIEDLCEQGLAALADLEEVSGPQQDLFSHGMWPLPHFFGAVLTSRRAPEVRWTAAFSHPLSWDPGGAPRTSEPGGGALHDELCEALRQAGLPVPETASVFGWAEYVAFALADRLVFASAELRDSMLGHPLHGALADAAAGKASVVSLREPSSVPAGQPLSHTSMR